MALLYGKGFSFWFDTASLVLVYYDRAIFLKLIKCVD